MTDLPLPNGRAVSLAGFSQRPFDTRSACFTVMEGFTTPEEDAVACRGFGAPVTFLCVEDQLLWWKQTSGRPEEFARVPIAQLTRFFDEHRDDFAPQTIYRAKTLGRFDQQWQREFVDIGLMPVVEHEAGQAIERLLLDSVVQLRTALHWPKELEKKPAQWLVKSVFWLLGAKMLKDKSVEGFVRMNFDDVDDVFARVGRHYHESVEDIVSSQPKRAALQSVAKQIAAFASLRLASTEALAYIYENTLISDQVREEFGTHSTPSYLVDYIIGRLAPWIEAIPQDQRSVFEPACGHGAFSVAAVRYLTSLLPRGMAEPSVRRAYLRQRVRGCDADEFALEIARLSLTLADIPNPNGWSLDPVDVFTSDILETSARKATIVLANPPFENFKPEQRKQYAHAFRDPKFTNKTAEILSRTLAAMPAGAAFGFVMPQNLLHSSNATEFRRWLSQNCEFEEICLFPDKVFNFADHESAILVGRKQANGPSRRLIRYRRVREREMQAFRLEYRATSETSIPHSRLSSTDEFDFRVPDLREVWAACEQLPKLPDFVDVGQGFSFIGEDQPGFPKGGKTVADEKFVGAARGFENLGSSLFTHAQPPIRWLNLSPEIILRPRSGTVTGMPQVLVNEAPVQRAPWCLKACLDETGRPATTCFTLLRPKSDKLSLKVVWALANSPIANAFAYAHSSKWHILTGTWRQLPVPDLAAANLGPLEAAVAAYFAALKEDSETFALRSDDGASTRVDLRNLHWRIDAEVLRLYQLLPALERQVLDYFSGWRREGVPFDQDRYLPAHFEDAISLADYLDITTRWSVVNRRRLLLIERKLGRNISAEERQELQHLKGLARAKAHLSAPLPEKELGKIEQDLRRRNLWKGA